MFSCYLNVHSIGLFAPRVGQQYRDEQRRRRSQYDRGTTAAEREIVCVRTCAPRRPSIVNGLRNVPCTLPAMKAWYDPQSSCCSRSWVHAVGIRHELIWAAMLSSLNKVHVWGMLQESRYKSRCWICSSDDRCQKPHELEGVMKVFVPVAVRRWND